MIDHHTFLLVKRENFNSFDGIELKDGVKSPGTVKIVPTDISATGLIHQNRQPKLELLGINKNVLSLFHKAGILNITRIEG